jgi:hypothetical protein
LIDPAEIELLAAADRVFDGFFAAAPVEELERLARRYFSRSAPRRLSAELLAAGGPVSGFTLADNIAKELGHYAASGWRFERGRMPPADPRRRLLHRILTLGRGDLPGHRHLRRALAGLAKNSPRSGQQDAVLSIAQTR